MSQEVQKYAKVLTPAGEVAYVYIYYDRKDMDAIVAEDDIAGDKWKKISQKEYSAILEGLYNQD